MERNKMTGQPRPGEKSLSQSRPNIKFFAVRAKITPALVAVTLATILLGSNFLISAGIFRVPTPAFAQTPSEASVQLNPTVLSIIYTPSDFLMTPINISSPIETYYSYYNNPRTEDPDENPATRDGTALRVQDGRFKGGFELQAQVDANYTSEGNAIPKENLGLRTDIEGNSQINETVTTGTTATTAPLDSAEDYTSFKTPLVLLDGTTASCDEGRVGIYTVYPSFRLLIPNNTPAGTYTTSVTYTLLEQPTC